MFLRRPLPEPISGLANLAANLWWSWHPEARGLFERLDPSAWEACRHNPYRLLQVVGTGRLREAAADPAFVAAVRAAEAALELDLARPPGIDADAGAVIAYFSMEFGLAECLPSYSGGLGVLAGDHLKSAHDLALPLVGVGLFYRHGYFRQQLAPDGTQLELPERIDRSHHPIEPARTPEGHPVAVRVPIEGRQVVVRAWRLDVGRVPLVLLETDDPANEPADRRICDRLYDADLDTRIRQEIVLGVGGVRALRAMGLAPVVSHMNEGHSALLSLERARWLMEEFGLAFREAWWLVWSTSVFTTHTAVAAGIDLFPPDLVLRHLGPYLQELGVAPDELLGLGRTDPQNHSEPFSMALLGLRASAARNAVSRIHRRVSQELWSQAWENVPAEDVPIGSVTNGVHVQTWMGPEMASLLERVTDGRWRRFPADPASWEPVLAVPDEELWEAHLAQRERLLDEVAARMRAEAVARGELAGASGRATVRRDALTIGFARRFAGYKRAHLLFRDPERLARIVNDPDRPVQVIFAGKAHPRDEPAKQIIREVVAMSRRPEFRGRIIILERYDLHLARLLVQGCDLWLNTPLRPLEACGTSGMKAAMNGVLHASVPDGWWPEAYEPGLGWQIGDAEPREPDAQDLLDAEAVYALLEEEILPAYFDREPDGVPARWVAMMKRSIAKVGAHFNSVRMVQEYLDHAYLPSLARWRELTQDGASGANALAEWERRVRERWPELKVLAAEFAADEVGTISAAVELYLGGLSPHDVRVELVAGEVDEDGLVSPPRTSALLSVESQRAEGVARFSGTVRPDRGGRLGLAVRVTPCHPLVPDPFALGLVLWA